MSNKMQILGYEIVGGREHRLADGASYPIAPSVTITLNSYAGSVSISPFLATESEVESYCTKLIENVEAISRLAKGQLRLAR
jgi:hypothetical protein